MSKIFVHIGLEVHCQLLTKTKLFSNCAVGSIDRYTLGYPGTLPVLNKEAVEFALKLAFALNCRVNRVSRFDRKHYFYPDLPKGFQITQNEIPLAENGRLQLASGRNIKIKRIHIEEDAGKSIRKNDELTVDYSRAGVPLVEIVTYPDIQSPEVASDFIKEIRNIAQILGINNGDLQNGEIRCDANISASYEPDVLGVKVEIKNLNSFKFIRDALKYEIKRQSDILRKGLEISECTVKYDEKRKKTVEIRKKETTKEYKYLPEPDIPKLILSDELIHKVNSELPELPCEIRQKLSEKYNLRHNETEILIENQLLYDYYCSFPENEILDRKMFNSVFFNDLLFVKEESGSLPVIEHFLYVYNEYAKEQIPKNKIALLLLKSINEQLHPEIIAKKNNYFVINDEEKIREWLESAINENPVHYKEFISGNKKLQGFFIGQVSKKSGGVSNPKIVEKVLLGLIR